MHDDYLWDRAGKPDADLAEWERELGAHRYRPAPLRAQTAWPQWRTYALAAVLLLAALLAWRGRAPVMSNWQLHDKLLAMHETIVVDKAETVQVASIGRLSFKPGSRFRIVQSEEKAQVMELLEGSFDALIISDPYVFQVITPPAKLDDLGCAYNVTVLPSGNGSVAVALGWVRVKAKNEDSLVKQGYQVDLVRGQPPSIPRAIVASGGADALSLLHLLWRGETASARGKAFDELAALHPPPAGVTRERALAADRSIVKDYWPALDLGPAVPLPENFRRP